jgi:hypothetical protein
MGIDGWQTLHIRGHESVIKQIEASGAALAEGSEDILYIANRFFGKAEVTHRSEKYIVFSYEYRNFPIHEYLEELLITYPTCWIKNTYRTEEGNCGMWIGRFIGEEPDIQELKWRELNDDEELLGEDFSNY